MTSLPREATGRTRTRPTEDGVRGNKHDAICRLGNREQTKPGFGGRSYPFVFIHVGLPDPRLWPETLSTTRKTGTKVMILMPLWR